MIEAVENHIPQVIIIDEIGTDLEVLASNYCRKRVQLVGTTHSNCLENLIKIPH
jgi:stage III sporulation protein SpoIIIAA